MKKKGFTLIELMIVIAIIALLAAVALPKFTSASEAAKVANVQGNLANLRTALAIHYAKHRAYPVLGTDIAADGDITATSNFAAYYSKSKMPETPAGTNVTTASNAVTATAGDNGGWVYNDGTGEIHADLPDEAYGDDTIDWTEE